MQNDTVLDALKLAKEGLRDWELQEKRYAALDAVDAAIQLLEKQKADEDNLTFEVTLVQRATVTVYADNFEDASKTVLELYLNDDAVVSFEEPKVETIRRVADPNADLEN